MMRVMKLFSHKSYMHFANNLLEMAIVRVKIQTYHFYLLFNDLESDLSSLSDVANKWSIKASLFNRIIQETFVYLPLISCLHFDHLLRFHFL